MLATNGRSKMKIQKKCMLIWALRCEISDLSQVYQQCYDIVLKKSWVIHSAWGVVHITATNPENDEFLSYKQHLFIELNTPERLDFVVNSSLGVGSALFQLFISMQAKLGSDQHRTAARDALAHLQFGGSATTQAENESRRRLPRISKLTAHEIESMSFAVMQACHSILLFHQDGVQTPFDDECL